MLTAVVVVVAAGYVVVRRSVGEPLNVRDLAVPPLLLLALGVRELVRGEDLTGGQIVVLVVVGATALAFGAWRAATVRLFVRDGELWYRYRPVTYLVWVATTIFGVVVRLGSYAAVSMPVSVQSLYLTVGLTLAGESLVLAGRGLRTAADFARKGRDDEGARPLIHTRMRRWFDDRA